MPSCGGSIDTSDGASRFVLGSDDPVLLRHVVRVSSRAEIFCEPEGSDWDTAAAIVCCAVSDCLLSCPSPRWRGKFLETAYRHVSIGIGLVRHTRFTCGQVRELASMHPGKAFSSQRRARFRFNSSLRIPGLHLKQVVTTQTTPNPCELENRLWRGSCSLYVCHWSLGPAEPQGHPPATDKN